jgi:hypothetical protein
VTSEATRAAMYLVHVGIARQGHVVAVSILVVDASKFYLPPFFAFSLTYLLLFMSEVVMLVCIVLTCKVDSVGSLKLCICVSCCHAPTGKSLQATIPF